MKLAVGFRWNQSSKDVLNYAENQLLRCLTSQFTVGHVDLNENKKLWTLKMNEKIAVEKPNQTPLVLVHGLGGGIGLWVLNLDSLSQNRPLFAMDVLGFGKSSRVPLSSNPSIAEMQWVDSLEEWRQRLGIGPMYLLGHSLGGFLASSYALRYPQQVKHLILVEPWGITEKPADYDQRPRPLWVRGVTALIRQFDPLAGLRVAGPWGQGLIRRLRPDLGRRFSSPRAAADIVYQYIHQCNVISPATGESAFRTLADVGWARNPMIHRIGRIPPDVPITCIYGARSWLDSKTGYLIAATCHKSAPESNERKSNVRCYVLPNAGHHVYADQAPRFNNLVNELLLEHDDKS